MIRMFAAFILFPTTIWADVWTAFEDRCLSAVARGDYVDASDLPRTEGTVSLNGAAVHDLSANATLIYETRLGPSQSCAVIDQGPDAGLLWKATEAWMDAAVGSGRYIDEAPQAQIYRAVRSTELGDRQLVVSLGEASLIGAAVVRTAVDVLADNS